MPISSVYKRQKFAPHSNFEINLLNTKVPKLEGNHSMCVSTCCETQGDRNARDAYNKYSTNNSCRENKEYNSQINSQNRCNSS